MSQVTQAAIDAVKNMQTQFQSGVKEIPVPPENLDTVNAALSAAGLATGSDMNPTVNGLKDGDTVLITVSGTFSRCSNKSRADKTCNGIYTVAKGTGSCNGKTFPITVLCAAKTLVGAQLKYKVKANAEGRLGYEKADEVIPVSTPNAANIDITANPFGG